MRLITLYHRYRGRAVAVLLGVTAVSVFLYGALLLGAVAHAAGRTSAERSIHELDGKVGALEAQYLQATKALSPERARELGFVTPTTITSVYASVPVLTLAGEQR